MEHINKAEYIKRDKIDAFVINLAKRTDRKAGSRAEFSKRNEFKVNIVAAIANEIGAVGLWQTICSIIRKARCEGLEYILICEDDHMFTSDYDKDLLNASIIQAKSLNADFLLGGVSWFDYSLQVAPYIFWVNDFTGLQFVVIFNLFFDKVLNATFEEHDTADHKFAALSVNKFLIHPFISIQKEYGYSDVTVKNATRGYVSQIFNESGNKLEHLRKVVEFYGIEFTQLRAPEISSKDVPIKDISILTYLFNICEKKVDYNNVFKDKPGFQPVKIIKSETSGGIDSLWDHIKTAIKECAVQNEDIVIFCDSNHEFTEHYSFYFLLQQIIEANRFGVGLLIGGVSRLNLAVPITPNLCWVDIFDDAGLFIVYRNIFTEILDEEVGDRSTVSQIFSEITSNKMIIFPFISQNIQTISLNTNPSSYNSNYNLADNKIEKLYEIKKMFGNSDIYYLESKIL